MARQETTKMQKVEDLSYNTKNKEIDSNWKYIWRNIKMGPTFNSLY